MTEAPKNGCVAECSEYSTPIVSFKQNFLYSFENSEKIFLEELKTIAQQFMTAFYHTLTKYKDQSLPTFHSWIKS